MSFFNFKKSVDSIVADITQKIEHLHVLAELHDAEAEVHNIAAAERAKLSAWFTSEAVRAKAIAHKLTALVTP